MYKYVYGPIPSRRLGISLGLDLVPLKICTYNCVYCECGRNTRLTDERKEYISSEEILQELRDFLNNNPMPDYISLSGSGEPTLNSKLGLIIHTIKKEFPAAQIAVLTNGSLLYQEKVREELMEADIVLPSLDGATQTAFMAIDRPGRNMKLPQIISGIAQFTKEFKEKYPQKEVWLEIFIIDGINTDHENIEELRKACILIQPDRIQLNTLDRPGTETWVKPASKETLENVRSELKLENVEIISKYKYRNEMRAYSSNIENTILGAVARRPCTLLDLVQITGKDESEIQKYLDILQFEKKIFPEIRTLDAGRGIFYKLTRLPVKESEKV